VSIDSGQVQRGLKALLAALELARKINAGPMIATTYVNLSDCYLKQRDYRNALAAAQQALEQARLNKNEQTMATARVNIGQVYLAMGRLAEGKKFIEEGMAWYEKSGHKPELQVVLTEYGDALERAGDLPARSVGLPPRAQAVERAVREAPPEGDAGAAGKVRSRQAPAPDRRCCARKTRSRAPRSTTAACSSASGGCWRWCSRCPR
jgi:tetratricopeptide (TPR) repeat protein